MMMYASTTVCTDLVSMSRMLSMDSSSGKQPRHITVKSPVALVSLGQTPVPTNQAAFRFLRRGTTNQAMTIVISIQLKPSEKIIMS